MLKRSVTYHPDRPRHGPAILGGVILLALASLASLLPAAEKTGGGQEPLTIGVVNSLFQDIPEGAVKILLRPFQAIMEEQTGVDGRIALGGDALNLGRQLEEEKIQLGVFHGFEFAWAKQKYPRLEPLVIVSNPQLPLRAYLVVRKDSGMADMAALKGKSLALAKRSKPHCRLFLERRCQVCGEQIKGFFAEVEQSGSLEEALDSVITGEVKATVVDAAGLDWYRQRKPGCHDRLKTIAESEVFPPGVVAYRPGAVDAAVAKRFRDGMIDANQNERGKQLLKMCQIAGFATVPDDYVKHLTDIAKLYPPQAGVESTGKPAEKQVVVK